MFAQNLQARDVSSVIAGRDIRYALGRADNGAIQPDLSEIAIDGPGTLQLYAGRNLDLQTSAGVSSRGNLQNSALPAEGADISVQVGTATRAPDYDAFIDKYLASAEFAEEFADSSGHYRKDLIAYMHVHGYEGADFEEALAAFRELHASAQAPLLERLLFSELRSSGRSAAQPGARTTISREASMR